MSVDFEQVYAEQGDYAFNLARRLCGSTAEAEDVFQEAFLRIYRFLPRFRGDSLRGWVRRIVVNAFYDQRHKVRRIYPAEELVPPGADRGDSSNDPGARSALDWRLEKALSELAEEHRTILTLRADDLSYEDLAELLEVPVGTVRSRLARARAALREKLEPQEVSHG